MKLRHLIVSAPHPLFNPTTTNYGTSLYPRHPVRLRLRFPHGAVFRTTRRILSEIHVARPGADRPDGQSRAVGCVLPFGTTGEALRVGGSRRADGPAMAGISAKRFVRQSRRMQPDYRRGGSSGGDGAVRGAFFAPGSVPAVYRALRPACFSRTPCRGADGRTAARTADGYGRAAARAIRTAPSRLCEPALSGRPEAVPNIRRPLLRSLSGDSAKRCLPAAQQFRDPGGTPADGLRAQMAVRAAAGVVSLPDDPGRYGPDIPPAGNAAPRSPFAQGVRIRLCRKA